MPKQPLPLSRERAYFDPSARAARENWPVVKIGSILDVFSGFAFKSNRFNDAGHGTPIIRIRDIRPNRTTTFYDGEYDKAYVVHNGDLLIGMDGDFNPVLWNGGDALLNQRVCRLQGFKEVSKEYIVLAIRQKLKEIEASTYAATVRHISAKQIKDISLPLPPPETQQQIAAQFAEEAEIIAANRKLITLYETKIADTLANI